MLYGCLAFPFVGLLKQQDDPFTIQYTNWQGPGKPNKVNAEWADYIIAHHKTNHYQYSIHRYIDTVREYCDKVWLPESFQEWFTGKPSDEEYLWYGKSELVKDTMYLQNGSVKVAYYICRGENSIRGRKATANDLPKNEDWQNVR